MPTARTNRVRGLGRRVCAVALACGLVAAGRAAAQDTCDVEFQLDDAGPLSVVAFSAAYPTALGDFVGDSTSPGLGPSWGTELVACSSLVPAFEFTVLDDDAGVLSVFLAADLGAPFVGPVSIATCVFALDAGFPCPTAGDLVIGDASFPDDPFSPPFALPSAPAISVTVAARTPVCGDGFQEGAEECDDGNTSDGDCCSSTCTLDAAGAPCSDASVCTIGESCDGAGACTGGSPLACDDGLPCTHDVCDPLLGCQALVEPDPACHPMTKAKLVIGDKDDDTADRIKVNAKMGGAPETVGDPTDTTAYTVCVFDAVGGVTSNVLQIDVPPGPPWAVRGGSGSFGYADPSRANDGVEKIRLKASLKPGFGNAAIKFLLVGKGAGLPLPGPAAADAYFAADPEVTIQIESSATDEACWRSDLPALRNRAQGFTGKRSIH